MTQVMDKQEIESAIARIARDILDKHAGTNHLALVGIRTGGVYLCARLSEKVHQLSGKDIPRGTMDITLYRDDLSKIGYAPMVKKTEIRFSVDDKAVILVDDVLYTGRTIRAAMDALMDLGRPRLIQLAVLVDRGHRELPISADYVGKTIRTDPDEIVDVLLTDAGAANDAVIVRKAHEPQK